jgi:hypothetical protein
MVICYTMLFKNFQNNYGSGGGLFLQNFGWNVFSTKPKGTAKAPKDFFRKNLTTSHHISA